MRLETEDVIRTYQGDLFRLAFSVCKNAADAEDILQDVFISYHSSKKQFQSERHLKAWLMKVVVNRAKNVNKSFWKRNFVPIEEYMETLVFESEETVTLFEEVMKLPDKYRVVIHLFYYEEYSVAEIADILGISQNNVKVRLNRARNKLRENMQKEGEYHGYEGTI